MKTRLFLAALLGLLLTACATIPQGTVDLANGVSKGVEAQQKTIDQLFDANIERDIRVYRSEKRSGVWAQVTTVVTQALAKERGGTLADVLSQKIKLTGEDHQLIGRVQIAVDEAIETKIKDAWEVSRVTAKTNAKLLLQMNKAVTENVSAHRSLQLRQRAVLTQVSDLADVDLGKVDKAVADVLNVAAGLEGIVNTIQTEGTTTPPAKGK